MAVSTINTRTAFEAKTDSNDVVRIKVTSVDAKGQMFRHPATVLTLDGRSCEFLSQSRPEQDGSVLVEFDYSKGETKHCVSQARVKSIQAADSGLYRILVQLEIGQTAKVTASPVESSSQSTEKKLLLMLQNDVRKVIPVGSNHELWALIQGKCEPRKMVA